MSISKKGDSIWIVIIGVIFITIISLILLVPKSYFNMEKYIDMPIGAASMNAHLTTGVSVDTFEKSFKNAFVNPDTIAFTFSDGNNLLIARRCYQFTDFGCKYESDTVKRNRCEEYKKNWLNNNDVKKYGLDKIDYSISSVMTYFDSIAAGQGTPFNILCRTYRLYSGNPGEINSVIMSDVKKHNSILQKPIEGGVHVLIVQAPYHRNYSGEFLSVNYTSSTTQAVFDNYDDKKGSKRSAPSIEGKVLTYVVIIYGRYQRDGNSLNSYDLFDGTGGAVTDDYLVKHIDKYYRSQEDNCKIKCAGSSDTYCGCGSTPVIPGFVANTAQGDKPSTSMKLELPKDQRLINPTLDSSTYYTNFNTLYKPSTNSKIINNLPDVNIPRESIYPYQSKCVGPNYPLALQDNSNKNDLNATTLATFAVLYRVNPKSGFDKDVFKVMDDKYATLN